MPEGGVGEELFEFVGDALLPGAEFAGGDVEEGAVVCSAVNSAVRVFPEPGWP